MFKNKQLVLLGLIVLFLSGAIGCKSKFEKLRTGTDVPKKYQEAIRLYNKKKYSKALLLFDDLMQRYRGMSEAEDLSYYFAYTNYRLRDYTTARYQFKVFADTYPGSSRAEECRFMSAYCYYLESPNFSLDQENTQKAIESLQLFINLYPKSERVAEASKLITDLRDKLEAKAYANAKLYFTTGGYNPENYRAAVIAFRNVLRDFPDTRYAEEMELLAIRSQYLYSKNSYETKQEERFNEAITMAGDFADKHPQSKLLKDVQEVSKDAQAGIVAAKKFIALQEAEMKARMAARDTTARKNK
ncbi:outer membrane protein assembly factor BamD [Hufsiella ginkgonis]|uniref:Outer membrane protein assembly factor BamD n=1 Tax=Hufsiella ginkgonis TaxID=2695274 RepID=A0A7K1XVB2_9SPHI|nr:outer membrane protein assembly factor BamD [Hufsiella ginkgonis]MXV14737.1 outer membrane protein assembly factor BamD [Hufsiella ginkgonis]